MRISDLNFDRESCPYFPLVEAPAPCCSAEDAQWTGRECPNLLEWPGRTEAPKAGKQAHTGQKATFSLAELRMVALGKVSYKYSALMWQNSHSFRAGNICVLPANLTGLGHCLLPRFPFPSGRIKTLVSVFNHQHTIYNHQCGFFLKKKQYMKFCEYEDLLKAAASWCSYSASTGTSQATPSCWIFPWLYARIKDFSPWVTVGQLQSVHLWQMLQCFLVLLSLLLWTLWRDKEQRKQRWADGLPPSMQQNEG